MRFFCPQCDMYADEDKSKEDKPKLKEFFGAINGSRLCKECKEMKALEEELGEMDG